MRMATGGCVDRPTGCFGARRLRAPPGCLAEGQPARSGSNYPVSAGSSTRNTAALLSRLLRLLARKGPSRVSPTFCGLFMFKRAGRNERLVRLSPDHCQKGCCYAHRTSDVRLRNPIPGPLSARYHPSITYALQKAAAWPAPAPAYMRTAGCAGVAPRRDAHPRPAAVCSHKSQALKPQPETALAPYWQPAESGRRSRPTAVTQGR